MISKKTEMMRRGEKTNQQQQKKEVLSNKYGKRIQEGSGAAPAAVPPQAGRWRQWPGGRGKHAGLRGQRFLPFPLENVENVQRLPNAVTTEIGNGCFYRARLD